jgi:hypothetical protein
MYAEQANQNHCGPVDSLLRSAHVGLADSQDSRLQQVSAEYTHLEAI